MTRVHSDEAQKAITALDRLPGQSRTKLEKMHDSFILDLAKNQLHDATHLYDKEEYVKDGKICGRKSEDDKVAEKKAEVEKPKTAQKLKPETAKA